MTQVGTVKSIPWESKTIKQPWSLGDVIEDFSFCSDPLLLSALDAPSLSPGAQWGM